MIEKNETDIMKSWTYSEPFLLTVVVISFNHENYIAHALDGILMQETDFPFEIIVHDDCSTDNTVKILEEYAKKYPTIIRLILQKENQHSKGIKPTAAPFEKAVGKYIAICEGDDYWIDPFKLQIQLDEMRKIENCQMSFHSTIDVWEDKSKKDEITTKQADGNKLFTAREVILGGGGFCPTVSLIFEKEAIMNLPEWYENAPFGDYFLQIFGSLKGGALYIDRTMSVYRRNATGSWSSMMLNIEKREKQFERMKVTLDEMDRYFERKFHSEVQQIESDWYLRLALVYLRNKYFNKFNQAIDKSYYLSEKKSKKLLLSFYLRKFPIILYGIGELNKKLNKYLVSKG